MSNVVGGPFVELAVTRFKSLAPEPLSAIEAHQCISHQPTTDVLQQNNTGMIKDTTGASKSKETCLWNSGLPDENLQKEFLRAHSDLTVKQGACAKS